ncbi:flavin reductase family protein [Aurantimonas sp. HBX-1]|uniref:flavin reductase family protein n=1 Tax=Aurantimonas sp. HBX-1 TaxID=2906072 RepID=UPI00351D0955
MLVANSRADAVVTRHGLRRAMRGLAGGVSVVTAGPQGDRTGATVTSAHSLSMEPETMVVSINLGSSTSETIRRYGHFCVNILSVDQREVAERFAGFGGLKGESRYEGANWYQLATGAAALDGALASIDCEVEEIIARHSHAIILGAVRAVAATGGTGLIYADGRYGSFSDRSV